MANETSQGLDAHTLRAMLGAYRAGELDEAELISALDARQTGFESSSLGRFDTVREARTGVPVEVHKFVR